MLNAACPLVFYITGCICHALINGVTYHIEDAQLAASSTNVDCTTETSRLYSDLAWCAGSLAKTHWIQVIALLEKCIIKVV